MIVILLPILLIAPDLILAALCLLLLFSLCASALATKRLRGRTTRRFQSNDDVWAIVDNWSATRKYKLIKKDDASRTYRRRSVTNVAYIPKVRIARTGGEFRLEAWLVARTYFRILCFLWFFPREVVIHIQSYFIGWGDWNPLDIRLMTSQDVNALIRMLKVEIEPIP